jgi:hypothetical protein
MKRLITFFWIIGALLILSAGRATAFTHYSQNEFKTAESLDPGMTQIGVNFTYSDDYETYYPEIRYGLGAMFEVGARFGATSASTDSGDKLGFYMGADLKYQIVKETEGVPIDIAVDLGLNNTIITDQNATEVTFAAIGSKSFPLTDWGYKLIPYGGLAMSSIYGSLPDYHDTYLNAFAGLEWKISQKFMVLLEFKTGESTMAGAGIRVEY